MAKAKSAWGIDIGQCALKAVKLRDVGGQLQVEAFDVIEHAQILSEPQADRNRLIQDALGQFLSRNNVAGSAVAVSVPGQTGFTRFVKLPPVEAKRIPDIVRFEAEQQIPFPIADVIWRWQTFADPNSPDKEVGIFAMKRIDVAAMLNHFESVMLPVDMVQMAPLALYNFMRYDGQVAEQGATLLADIGADKTDLVVCDGSRIWTRTIQIGGNSFTQALVKAFKLTFRKAEKLKRTAATSKYARQIFQAMRPVFSDLVQEIQRSIGYYTSLHRESRFSLLVGMGNGFRLPGMQKFLEQNLNLKVNRIDSFSKLSMGTAVNAAHFNENVLSLGVAYGLAVQGVGLAAVTTNLLPEHIASARRWKKKQPWFAASAAAVLLAMAGLLYGVRSDMTVLSNGQVDLKRAETIIKQLRDWRTQYQSHKNEGKPELEKIKSYFELFAYRDYWPSVQALISQAVLRAAGDQRLILDYVKAGGTSEQARKRQEQLLQELKAKPRDTRRLIFIESMDYEYLPDVTQAGVAAGRSAATAAPQQVQQGPSRGYRITLTGRTPLSQGQANRMLESLLDTVQKISSSQGFASLTVRHSDIVSLQPYGAAPSSARPTRTTGFRERREGWRGAADERRGMEGWGAERRREVPMPRQSPLTPTQTQVENPDPLLPDESMSNDTKFTIELVVSVDDDGVKLPEPLASLSE